VDFQGKEKKEKKETAWAGRKRSALNHVSDPESGQSRIEKEERKKENAPAPEEKKKKRGGKEKGGGRSLFLTSSLLPEWKRKKKCRKKKKVPTAKDLKKKKRKGGEVFSGISNHFLAVVRPRTKERNEGKEKCATKKKSHPITVLLQGQKEKKGGGKHHFASWCSGKKRKGRADHRFLYPHEPIPTAGKKKKHKLEQPQEKKRNRSGGPFLPYPGRPMDVQGRKGGGKKGAFTLQGGGEKKKGERYHRISVRVQTGEKRKKRRWMLPGKEKKRRGGRLL